MPRHHVKETERLSTLTNTCIQNKRYYTDLDEMPMRLLLQHRKGTEKWKIVALCITRHVYKNRHEKKVGKGPSFFLSTTLSHPVLPPFFFHNAFLKHNLPKVFACLVDFHFRCCQLKGIWTNQYLSVFWHTQSWLLEKSFL